MLPRGLVWLPGGALLTQMYGALVKLGRTAEADASMRAWLRKHPADVPTRLHYACGKLAGDDAKAAIAQLELVLKYAPDNLAALNDLAWSYQRVGERKGLALAQRAHALAPDNPAVMDTLGWIYLEQGELARALPKSATTMPCCWPGRATGAARATSWNRRWPRPPALPTGPRRKPCSPRCSGDMAVGVLVSQPRAQSPALAGW